MSSFDEGCSQPIWERRNRDSLGSLSKALTQSPDFASVMAASMAGSANRPSLISNPWDASTAAEILEAAGSGANDVPDLPASHYDLPPSLFTRTSPLDNTTSLISPTQSTLSLMQHNSSSSLDYVSPTEATHTVEPDPDPWQATIPKLDITLGASIPAKKADSSREGGASPLRNEGSKSRRSPGKNATLSRLPDTSAQSDMDDETFPKPDASFLYSERIKVTIAPEKGGLVFKHVNYIIESQERRCTVLRRYSDFLWLLDVLTRRYPFRMIPALPPKRVKADQSFLERRRRALSRFINLVANHPVLREDDSVIAFLTVEMDLNSFRKKATINYDEEIPHFNLDALSALPPDLPARIVSFKGNLDFFIVQFRDLATLMERITMREDANAMDTARYGMILSKLTERTDCTKQNCSSCPVLIDGYKDLSEGLQRVGRIKDEEAQSTFDNLVESVKMFRDLLIAAQELFLRQDRALSVLNIDVLNKRIASHETRLREIQGDKANPKEADKLNAAHAADVREVELQGQRIDLIRFCAWQELQYYHKQKAFLSLMYQEFVSEKIRFTSHYSELWKSLASSVFELPTAEFAT
ncbi:hypothetical protein DFS34DRAFT_639435 [Phlyctochytrium arcticum]|nr:hypothetical protein DFS34DRAFT_639435 [Phlyctochytrium arcticum]